MKKQIHDNLSNARRHPLVVDKIGIFSKPDYSKLFTLTGAQWVQRFADLEDGANFFQSKPQRYFKRGNRIILRGRRYLAAIDPGLSVTQRLEILCEDLHDCIAAANELVLKTNPNDAFR